jgi:WXG100 family type VII secretion target
MPFEGMDVAQVQGLGRQLQGQADQINSTINTINSLVSQLQASWQGKDAKEFEGWWQQQHRPHLQQASEAIRGLGQSALNNAQEQINASGH